MPKINYPTLGDIEKTLYLPGRIHALHFEDVDTPEELWDTADVAIEAGFQEFRENVPIFYHCFPDVAQRANGALQGAAFGFDLDDQVIVACRLAMEQVQVGDSISRFEDPEADPMAMVVVSHKEFPRRCRMSWVVVFCTVGGHEWVTVYNTHSRSVLSWLKNPETGAAITFPCLRSAFEPWMISNIDNTVINGERVYSWPDWKLWEETPLDASAQMETAGGTPNWKEDFQGNTIRGGADPSDWWTSYNFYGNPTFNYFWDLQLKGLLADQAGVADGSFRRVRELIKLFEDHGWSGPGARQDYRAIPLGVLAPDGSTLQSESLHQQVGYGEDEVWVCGRNTFQGIIVSYCDQVWKYVRFENVPPAIPIGNPHMARLAGGSAIPMGAAPSVSTFADIGMALAADITQTVLDGSVIFICATLKRLNEGMFHLDDFPAEPGSMLLTAVPNPALPDEPTHFSALNLRRSSVNAWVRHDNWHNTLPWSASMGEANRTWWFRVWSTQTAWDNRYLDGPLGSMMSAAPHQRSVLWQSMGLRQGEVTVRQDWPLRSNHHHLHGQHEMALFQIQVCFRQGITLDGYPAHAGTPYFFRQIELEEPWHCLPSLADIPDYEIPEEFPVAPSQRDASIAMPATSKEGKEYAAMARKFFEERDQLQQRIASLADQIVTLEIIYSTTEDPEIFGQLAEAQAEKAEKEQALADKSEWFDSLDYVPAKEYVAFVGGNHITSMTDQQIGNVLDPHLFVHTGPDGSNPNPLRRNRSEIEIMAAADTWGDLFRINQDHHPRSQERDGAFEKAIADLIQATLDASGHWPKGFADMQMEARLI